MIPLALTILRANIDRFIGQRYLMKYKAKLRISYRVTSWMVVAVYLMSIVVGAELGLSGPIFPCQYVSWQTNLATLLFFTSAVTILVQGFRNRAAAVLLPIACLLTAWPNIQRELAQQCLTPGGRVGFRAIMASICLMCLHHLIQRPSKEQASS